jgi:hypothetical protein
MSDMDRDPRYGIVLIEDNLQPEFNRGPVGTYGEIFVCNSDFDSYIDMCLIEVHLLAFLTRNTNVRTNKQDFNSLRPNFCFVNVEHVKHMLENTTQYAHENIRLLLWKYFKSNFQQQTYPLSYWGHRYQNITFGFPTYDDGIMGHGSMTIVQIYVGKDSLLTDIYPIQAKSEEAGTFLISFTRMVHQMDYSAIIPRHSVDML